MVRVGLAGLGFMGGTHAQCPAAYMESARRFLTDLEGLLRQLVALAPVLVEAILSIATVVAAGVLIVLGIRNLLQSRQPRYEE